MEQKIIDLYVKTFGETPVKVEHLFGGGGSSRCYYIMSNNKGENVYGVTSKSPDENEAFYKLSLLFAEKKLSVPQVYAISEDRLCYLQQELGTTTLKDFLSDCKSSDGEINEKGENMLKEVMTQLPDIQFKGASDEVFNNCYPVPSFDRMSVMFDLNYFKYCFVKLLDIEFNEVLLQNDFERFTSDLLDEPFDTFLYRDFQARNIMIYNDKPYYIDYQGGRKGPIYYDVASFLWQASAGYSDTLRNELIDVYLSALKQYKNVSKDEFKSRLMLFVLFRNLQVLGAYGFRGLWEKKKHFIDSIPAGIANLESLYNQGIINNYPYLKGVAEKIIEKGKAMNKSAIKADQAPQGLTVQVTSFSFKKGIPQDESGNGGGYVFDCRSTNNPGRYDEYKQLTGLDKPVIDFLESDGEILNFLNNIYPLVDFHTKRFMDRGFTHLMISFGCTGGRHRSVYSAQHVAEHIHKKFGVRVELLHREQGIYKVFE